MFAGWTRLSMWGCLGRGLDPDSFVLDWLEHGAPLGMELHIPTCRIFPELESKPDSESVATGGVKLASREH
eukprot:2518380-Amphidinium_carterae.1